MLVLTKKLVLSEEQEKIITDYENGYASVLATPGAGKTTIITHLIEKMIKERGVDPRNILVLTLTESATREFKQRTKDLLKDIKNTPEFSTIHSFCNKILRDRFLGYSEMVLLPETKKNEKLEEILLSKGFKISKEFDTENQDIDYLELFRDSIIPMFRRDKDKFHKIKECATLNTDELKAKIGNVYNHHLKCFYQIPSVVSEYENFLREENFIDFDMMINDTLKLLLTEKYILEKIQDRFHFILEDEAQDSNSIQNQILELVAGESGNYVRVGDPNQSIFTTFTGADFKSLVRFHDKHLKMEIKHSNRSTQKIIDISNSLLDKFPESFPSDLKIKKGDYNPSFGEVRIKEFGLLSEEIDYITNRVEMINGKEKDPSFAVLTRTNNQAVKIYQLLTELGFDATIHGNKENDFFNNSVVEKISSIIGYVLYPFEVERLQKVLKLNFVPENIIDDLFNDAEIGYKNLKSISEDSFLYFGDDIHYDNLVSVCNNISTVIDMIYHSVTEILEIINNLFIEDIFQKATARLLNQMWLKTKPAMKNIQDFYLWLKKHSDIRIRQELFDEDDYTRSGVIHILTVHKAKGLQWDAVFLPNFSQWDYKDNTWRGINEKKDMKSVILSITENKRKNEIRKNLAFEEVQESRRVGYVGLTRAKKYLYLTCSEEGLGEIKNKKAEIFMYLKNFGDQDENN